MNLCHKVAQRFYTKGQSFSTPLLVAYAIVGRLTNDVSLIINVFCNINIKSFVIQIFIYILIICICTSIILSFLQLPI